MPSRAIINPAGAYRGANFLTGRGDDGLPLALPQAEVESWRANAAVLRGQALNWVAPTATVPLSVTPMAAATADHLFAGAALEDAAIGEQVQVCAAGFCEVLIDTSDTAAFGGVIGIPDATTGRFSTAAAEVDEVASVGICLGTESATDYAPALINRAGIPHVFETVA